MKNRHIQIIFVIAAALNSSEIFSKAQSFANLNFESALGSPINGGTEASDVGTFYDLPDWNVSTVGDQGSAFPGGVFYNTSILDGTDAYIVSGAGVYVPIGVVPSISPLDGNQSLALYVSDVADTGTLVPSSISISQTGVIPDGEKSVSFLLGYFATWYPPSGQNPLSYFSVSINNQNVPLVVTSENGQVLTVAGDISQWAGQSVTLTIANSVTPGPDIDESFGVIDDVAFSRQVVIVPEPSGIGLLVTAISLSAVVLNKRKIA